MKAIVVMLAFVGMISSCAQDSSSPNKSAQVNFEPIVEGTPSPIPLHEPIYKTGIYSGTTRRPIDERYARFDLYTKFSIDLDKNTIEVTNVFIGCIPNMSSCIIEHYISSSVGTFTTVNTDIDSESLNLIVTLDSDICGLDKNFNMTVSNRPLYDRPLMNSFDVLIEDQDTIPNTYDSSEEVTKLYLGVKQSGCPTN
jgi:hypothetical protein